MVYDDFTFEDLGKGYQICISSEHRFGTDAFLLADFTKPAQRYDFQPCFPVFSGQTIASFFV